MLDLPRELISLIGERLEDPKDLAALSSAHPWTAAAIGSDPASEQRLRYPRLLSRLYAHPAVGSLADVLSHASGRIMPRAVKKRYVDKALDAGEWRDRREQGQAFADLWKFASNLDEDDRRRLAGGFIATVRHSSTDESAQHLEQAIAAFPADLKEQLAQAFRDTPLSVGDALVVAGAIKALTFFPSRFHEPLLRRGLHADDSPTAASREPATRAAVEVYHRLDAPLQDLIKSAVAENRMRSSAEKHAEHLSRIAHKDPTVLTNSEAALMHRATTRFLGATSEVFLISTLGEHAHLLSPAAPEKLVDAALAAGSVSKRRYAVRGLIENAHRMPEPAFTKLLEYAVESPLPNGVPNYFNSWEPLIAFAKRLGTFSPPVQERIVARIVEPEILPDDLAHADVSIRGEAAAALLQSFSAGVSQAMQERILEHVLSLDTPVCARALKSLIHAGTVHPSIYRKIAALAERTPSNIEQTRVVCSLLMRAKDLPEDVLAKTLHIVSERTAPLAPVEAKLLASTVGARITSLPAASREPLYDAMMCKIRSSHLLNRSVDVAAALGALGRHVDAFDHPLRRKWLTAMLACEDTQSYHSAMRTFLTARSPWIARRALPSTVWTPELREAKPQAAFAASAPLIRQPLQSRFITEQD